jgi:hypothetical protein
MTSGLTGNLRQPRAFMPCGGQKVVAILPGVRIGQPLSRERYLFRMPTPLTLRKAKQGRHGFASALRSGVVVDPGMCVSSLYLGNREISCLAGRLRRRAGPCREGEEP